MLFNYAANYTSRHVKADLFFSYVQDTPTDEDSGSEQLGEFILCTKREGCMKPLGHKGRCRKNIEEIHFAEDHVQCARNPTCVNSNGHRGRCKLRTVFQSNGVLMGSPIKTHMEIKKKVLETEKQETDKVVKEGGQDEDLQDTENDNTSDNESGSQSGTDSDNEEEAEKEKEKASEPPSKGTTNTHIQCSRNSLCVKPYAHKGLCRTADNKIPGNSGKPPAAKKRPGAELERIKKEDRVEVADSEEEEEESSESEDEMELEDFSLPSWTVKRPRQGMGNKRGGERKAPPLMPAVLKKEAIEAAKGVAAQKNSRVPKAPLKPGKQTDQPAEAAAGGAAAAGGSKGNATRAPGPGAPLPQPPRPTQQPSRGAAAGQKQPPTAGAAPGGKPAVATNPAGSGRAPPPSKKLAGSNGTPALPPVPASVAASFHEKAAAANIKLKAKSRPPSALTNAHASPVNTTTGGHRAGGPPPHPQGPAVRAQQQQQQQYHQQQQQQQQQQRGALMNGTMPHPSLQQPHQNNRGPLLQAPNASHGPPGGFPGMNNIHPGPSNNNLSSSLIHECRELEAALAHCGLAAYDRLIYSMKFATLPVEVRMAHWDAVQRHIAEGNTLAVVVAVREQIRAHL